MPSQGRFCYRGPRIAPSLATLGRMDTKAIKSVYFKVLLGYADHAVTHARHTDHVRDDVLQHRARLQLLAHARDQRHAAATDTAPELAGANWLDAFGFVLLYSVVEDLNSMEKVANSLTPFGVEYARRFL